MGRVSYTIGRSPKEVMRILLKSCVGSCQTCILPALHWINHQRLQPEPKGRKPLLPDRRPAVQMHVTDPYRHPRLFAIASPGSLPAIVFNVGSTAGTTHEATHRDMPGFQFMRRHVDSGLSLYNTGPLLRPYSSIPELFTIGCTSRDTSLGNCVLVELRFFTNRSSSEQLIERNKKRSPG
jgi:hypothetical protein